MDFFNDLGKKLNFTTWEDWYQIKKQHIQEVIALICFFLNKQHGGSHMLLQLFDDNHIKAVTSVFPQYNWNMNRFAFKEKGFFTASNHR